ncbi:MAG: Ldh family oxidoreductase [Planctomycetota bacterium]|jgi:LDH2 family malate/lactate/ureidoglycolate dehydrogenase|nr:Ldh family oxidoreductase [Planctomycetota bacterium]MDP7131898.1 Ldh family oxidoreductase [Planctomycetota bacterium]MDP7253287.1 Ldh family oxidoreductase [Planctomycetota bacterium]
MNLPPSDYVSVREDRLLQFATDCFQKSGISAEHAALVSRLLVNSDLRGVRSHGTVQVGGYCLAFEGGSLNPAPVTKVVHETPTCAVVDGDGTLGYMPMMQAAELAVQKAKDVGIGMGLTRNIGHYGAAGNYVRACMEHGCIGYSSQGGFGQGNFRGQEPKPQIGYFGNPPFCIGIPSDTEPPVILDMATYILTGVPHGPEVEELFEKYPVAFYRSIGFGVIASLLGGGLAGVTTADAREIAEKWPSAQQGGVVLAVDVKNAVDTQIFLAEADRIVRDIRESYAPLPGHDEALVPGAIEERRFEFHRREGIRYGPGEQKAARSVADRLEIPLPWED